MTTAADESIMKKLPNIHPGEALLEEFLTPMGISQNALARATGVPPRRINAIGFTLIREEACRMAARDPGCARQRIH